MLALQRHRVLPRCVLLSAMTLVAFGLAPLAAAQAPLPDVTTTLSPDRGATTTAAPAPLPAPTATLPPATAAPAASPASPTAAPRAGWDSPPPGQWPPGLREAVQRATPPQRPYEEGRPVLPGYHLEERPRLALIIVGAGLFAGSYGFGAFATCSAGACAGLVPVAGPIIVAAQWKVSTDALSQYLHVLGVALLVFDTLVQGTGLGMTIGGLANPKKVQVLDTSSGQHKGPFLRFDARGPALVF